MYNNQTLKMKKHNLHTHTTYSDGALSPEDLVELAKGKKLEVLGISDHAFSKKLPPQYQITSRLESYIEYLRGIQNSLRGNGFDLKKGIEIDVSEICGTSPSQLPFDVLNEFDYVLFEYVNTENEYWGRVGNRDISEIVQVRNRLRVPIGLAHNDLQNNYDGKEQEITRILSDNNIFVELNQSEYHPRRGMGRNTRSGKDYYQHFSPKLLSELVSRGIKVVVGTDSHTGESLANVDDANEFIRKNNFQLHEMVS